MNKELKNMLIKIWENKDNHQIICDYIKNQTNPKTLTFIFKYDSLKTPSINYELYMNANTPECYLETIIDFLYQVYPDDHIDQLKLDREQYLERIQDWNNKLKSLKGGK